MMISPVLRERRLYVMVGFGFACGLPLALTGFTLRQWLSEGGVTLASIGFTAWIGLAYTLKFLWSPVLDRVAPPRPWRRLGRRRGWLLVVQPLLVLSCVALALSSPADPRPLVLAALAVAFCSATQDMIVDAWRIEVFPEHQQGVALAAYIWGYRVAFLLSGAGTIWAASIVGWQPALLGIAGIAALPMMATLLASEPAPVIVRAAGFRQHLTVAVIAPLRDLLARPGAGQILAFVMLFKLGEALAHTMAPSFYRAMGFIPRDVAFATGLPGLAASLTGAAMGGWLVIRVGTGRALITTGFVQMASMGLYFALAVSGGDWRILVTKVVVENFAEAMADAAFITYLSALCRTGFTATQYALLSALAALGLRTAGGFSGTLAEALGWTTFYGMTIFAAVPAMLIMVGLLRRFPPPPRAGLGPNRPGRVAATREARS